MKIIGICYYANFVKRREKEAKKLTTQKTLMTTHFDQQSKHPLDIISIENFIFELQEIGWDLSITRISYKLTKRTTKSKKNKNEIIQLSSRSSWGLSVFYDYLESFKKNKQKQQKKEK